MLSQTDFNTLIDQGFTHIPLVKKQLIDTQTPVTLLSRLKKLHPSAYLFESVEKAERWGRYSIIGLGSELVIELKNGHLTQSDASGKRSVDSTDPLDYIQQLVDQHKVPEHGELKELPKFSGGLVGYFGHDVVRSIEPVLGQDSKPNPMNLPDLWLTRSDQLLIVDNLKNILWIVVHANQAQGYQHALSQLETLEQACQEAHCTKAQPFELAGFESVTSKQDYESSVGVIKEYIKAGDVMQVVPAQRMQAEFAGDALSVYRALRHLNPSPYMFYVQAQTLQGQSFELVGSSPETLARIEDGKVTVRPLAGTRPRGKTKEEDLALEAELLADEKEVAEHLMLIDLGRNDVGRVAQVGKVQVTDQMFIERYSHVMHIASNVEAHIKPELKPLDVFKAVFPAGTLTGAPKIRAMQIIDELEPVRRTVFGGAVGYLGWNNTMDTAIAIRTAVITGGKVYVQAGAGVVEDSVPANEWQETLNKSQAVIRAVELAASGLELG